MTISELIIGALGLFSSWAICCLLGVFIGLHFANKEHKKELLSYIKELEVSENDRSNL